MHLEDILDKIPNLEDVWADYNEDHETGIKIKVDDHGEPARIYAMAYNDDTKVITIFLDD